MFLIIYDTRFFSAPESHFSSNGDVPEKFYNVIFLQNQYFRFKIRFEPVYIDSENFFLRNLLFLGIIFCHFRAKKLYWEKILKLDIFVVKYVSDNSKSIPRKFFRKMLNFLVIFGPKNRFLNYWGEKF